MLSGYWPSKTRVLYPDEAKLIELYNGVDGGYYKFYTYYVRVVRGGQ